MAINLNQYDFTLPRELLAAYPLADRASCRLMVIDRRTKTITHFRFSDLPQLLQAGDLVVLNNTKVIPSRLLGTRPQGGHVEVLLLRKLSSNRWEAMLKPMAKVAAGDALNFGPRLRATVQAKLPDGLAELRLTGSPSVAKALHHIGHVPLPPYLRRPDTAADRFDYQTIFARKLGAIAAPTAGLHFTKPLITELKSHGIYTAMVTLHVGLGTFQPLRNEQLKSGKLHAERFAISTPAAKSITTARRAGRRIIAVGTTVVRTLEHVAQVNRGKILKSSGETRLMIQPGFRFQVVDALITNFHLPKSSLLLLVAAFADPRLIRRAYREAIAERYRFYSYGDAMLVT